MTIPLSGRARKVLGRFPRHLEADSPGKLMAAVVAALVRDQDVQAAELQGIRRAHRLAEAPELVDLLLLGGLHGLRPAEMAVLFDRFAQAEAKLESLRAAAVGADASVLEGLAKGLLGSWSLAAKQPLARFSPTPEADTLDVAAAVQRLLPRAAAALDRDTLLDAVRVRIATSARIHIGGNGTVAALLTAAANALDLDLDEGEIVHSDDRYWHAAPVRDRLRLRLPPVDPGAKGEELDPLVEYLGLEENPRIAVRQGPEPRRHAELFQLIRKGFDQALLEIRVRGIGNRTIGPMPVNRDSGHGVGIYARVPDGKELVFTQQGRVLLDGADVTSRAWAWRGACFAATGAEPIDGSGGSRPADSRDFVFADADLDPVRQAADPRTSRFVLVTPVAGLDREARIPHAGDSLPMPGIAVGKTRFAFFVQQGFYSAARPTQETETPLDTAAEGAGETGANSPFDGLPAALAGRVKAVTPRYATAFADASLFAAAGTEANQPAAQVSLHWLEHQAYSVRLLIPNRFRAYDGVDGNLVRRQVGDAVQRFRPAGIGVQVDFVEDHWLLGKAALPVPDQARADPIARIQSDTLLWPTAATSEGSTS